MYEERGRESMRCSPVRNDPSVSLHVLGYRENRCPALPVAHWQGHLHYCRQLICHQGTSLDIYLLRGRSDSYSHLVFGEYCSIVLLFQSRYRLELNSHRFLVDNSNRVSVCHSGCNAAITIGAR